MIWRRSTKQDLDFQALLATPCDFDLSGHWRAYYPTPNGEVLSGVQLEQYGAAIFGRMQCKFAAAAPLSIRGILLGVRLVANYWRPSRPGMGSGIFDLTLTTDGDMQLRGTSTWSGLDVCGEQTYEWRWEKNTA